MPSVLLDAARRPFVDVAQEYISGSLVYLDQGAGEVAHSSLGLPFLLGECMGLDLRPTHGGSVCVPMHSSFGLPGGA